MLGNTNWKWIGALSAALAGAVVAGCGNQNGNPDNVAAAPRAAVNTANSAGAPATTGSFDAAATTMSQIGDARAELDTAITSKNLDQVHQACSKIRDLANTLPGKSLMLPDDKRKTLDAHVKNVGELSAMMDKMNDPNDMKPVQEHQTAMNEALDMMKGIYPAEAMQPPMHMPDMTAQGMKMPGMDDKMGGMDVMDKMTSGMSAADKNEMKMKMDRMMAMPPSERKKAMQKMNGMPMSGT